jgi:hypothetical protein
MANKRPLAMAATSATHINGGKQLRYDISQVKPMILKRSEILSKEASRLLCEHPHSMLSSCLRERRKSWSLYPETMTPARQNEACSVQFRSNVTVKRIPSRHEYSPSMRRELWTPLKELRENALRNEAEFSFDGCNWRECCEEQDMFFDKRSGSFIHPVHVETVCVFNGTEWKPIAKDEPIPEPALALKSVLPNNQVCIVCDFRRP